MTYIIFLPFINNLNGCVINTQKFILIVELIAINAFFLAQ